MELREWAIRILSAETLEDKLHCPDTLSDLNPGSALVWTEPSRPPGMHFQRHNRENKLPAFHTLGKEEHRAICLHRFAGHELLAVEIMAFALLAFPEAPLHFRRGLANTLKEEQGHVNLYTTRLNKIGIKFGDLPLFRHFWKHTPYLHSPLHYISMMSLTFEMANLDFAPLYGKEFKRHGDQESADLMETILKDEISHVRFGWRWLCNLKENHATPLETWQRSLPDLIHPSRAKGFIFNKDPREAAGIPTDWIDYLQHL
jgi:uncharacterized ferritin-like protein (DUF455 family)